MDAFVTAWVWLGLWALLIGGYLLLLRL